MATYNSYTPKQTFVANLPPPAVPVTSANGHSRIAYFITRNSGQPVPLIPADELPFTVKLQNVHRVLSPDQTYGLTYVGSAPYSGTTFKLEQDATHVAAPAMQRATSQPSTDPQHTRIANGITPKQFLAPDALARQALSSNTSVASTPAIAPKRPISSSSTDAATTSLSWRRTDPVPSPTPPLPPSSSSTDPTQSIIDAILATSSGAAAADQLGYKRASPPPSGVIPDQDKKEYCTYWILHGDCMYVQQGCRYKHEMPSKEKLHQIGIRHVPRWWLERNAVVRIGGRSAVGGGEGGRIVGGEVRKPEEWLKMRKGSEASVGSEGTVATTTVGDSDDEKCRNENADESPKSPVIPPARPSSPATSSGEEDEKIRKVSTAGSDLIDFPVLLPGSSPSSSASSSAATTPRGAGATTTTVAKRPVTLTEPTKNSNTTIRKPAPPTSSPKPPTITTRIFVPPGESPDKHIAEHKKRVAAATKSRAPSPPKHTANTTKPGDIKVLAKDPKRPNAIAIVNPKAKTEVIKPLATAGKTSPPPSSTLTRGLSASMWAPEKTATAAEKEKEKETVNSNNNKRNKTGSGCRVRRPASSSPAAAGAKKEKTSGDGEKKINI